MTASPALFLRTCQPVLCAASTLQNKATVGKLEGADAAELTRRVEALLKEGGAGSASTGAAAAAPAAAELPSLQALTKRVERLVNAAPVMLFIKGSPSEPKCKFSRRIVELLTEAGASFGSFDVLGDEAVRQGLKDYGNWPTYPQLWVDGKLVGGVDIVTEMKDSGELASILPAPPAPASAPATTLSPGAGAMQGSSSGGSGGLTPALTARLNALTSSSPVVLFMKGSPAAAACGFSERMVSLLESHAIGFTSFDILSDREVREGLKALHNWPTYPQLYVHGKLVGGLDVVKEMAEEAGAPPLHVQLGVPKKEALQDKLARLVSQTPIVLFMKGNPAEPRCGFSARAVELLRTAGVPLDAGNTTFSSFDILSDDAVRQGLKEYSNWPTYPQLYVSGKLVGGLDIMKEMADEGELAAALGL